MGFWVKLQHVTMSVTSSLETKHPERLSTLLDIVIMVKLFHVKL